MEKLFNLVNQRVGEEIDKIENYDTQDFWLTVGNMYFDGTELMLCIDRQDKKTHARSVFKAVSLSDYNLAIIK